MSGYVSPKQRAIARSDRMLQSARANPESNLRVRQLRPSLAPRAHRRTPGDVELPPVRVTGPTRINTPASEAAESRARQEGRDAKTLRRREKAAAQRERAARAQQDKRRRHAEYLEKLKAEQPQAQEFPRREGKTPRGRMSLEERRQRRGTRPRVKRTATEPSGQPQYKPGMGAAFYHTREWLQLRYRVLQRRGATCEACGSTRTHGVRIHVDHIKPRSKFPALELDENNLQVLCEPCNIGKSNKDSTDWRIKAGPLPSP